MSESSPPHFITIGHIGSAYGLKGWVNIISYTQPKTNIIDFSPWYLKIGNLTNESQYQLVKVSQIRKHGNGIVALLPESDNRNSAQTYRNVEIAILAEQLPNIEKDEYYWHDLIGLRVTTINSEHLGEVAELMETGANDVLVVEQLLDNKTKTRLIPFIIPTVVITIDLQQQTMVVDWDPDF